MFKNAFCGVPTSCSSTAFNRLLDVFLVLPAKVRITSDVSSGLNCCSLPEAREVVPVGDLPIKHGRLQEKNKQERRKGLIQYSNIIFLNAIQTCKVAQTLCYQQKEITPYMIVSLNKSSQISDQKSDSVCTH